MKFIALRPIISSANFQETVDFYTSILGFTCDNKNDDWGWASLHRDDVEIMISVPNDLTPFDKPIFTGSFYINTDKVDEVWDELKEKTKLAYPIENFEYGMREFGIYDNNGYLLQFGQDVATL